MQSVTFPSREIPIAHQADVVVIGGGPGGLGAALFAARAGARTLLIERMGYLGGMASMGEVHPFMPNHVEGQALDRPVFGQWARRMRAYYPPDRAGIAEDSQVFSGPDRMISKDAAMLAAEELCLDAGVELLYHHTLLDAIVDQPGRIDAAVLVSKSGLTAAGAKVFVDCSGDADLAARAGCGFEQGGPSGHSQPMTLCFKLAGVDRAKLPSRAEINRLYDQAKADGIVECPRENVLTFSWLRDDVVHFNTTRVVKRRATEGDELSQAEIEGRKQLRQLLAFLRSSVSGFENAWVFSVGQHIGVRESRRVLGRQYLTRDDFVACRKFPDAIARVNYNIDIHSPDGAGTEHLVLPEGEWYEIPYGCIVARDARNLLIGGRPISVDHAVHSSMRVMPPALSVGQAAGLAAAMSVRSGTPPCELDGVEVRKGLVEMGAALGEGLG
jgi:hypothetical protein